LSSFIVGLLRVHPLKIKADHVYVLGILNLHFRVGAWVMSFESEVKIELEQPRDGDLLIKLNSDSMNDIVVKKTGIPKEKMGGEARQLLAASLAECMCSTFVSLLEWARVKYEKLHATVTVSTGKDEKGRLCVSQIDVDMKVEIPEDEETIKRFGRAENLFKRGCLMSRSLERGIKVNYRIDAKSLHCK